MASVGTARFGRALAPSAAGAALAGLTWVIMVPRDLSEVDDQGRALDGGGDDNALLIGLVAVVVLMLGLVLTARSKTRDRAPAFVAGSSAAWAALFAWRAGVANVSGANMFVIPLLFLILPTAIAMPYLLRWVVDRLASDAAD